MICIPKKAEGMGPTYPGIAAEMFAITDAVVEPVALEAVHVTLD
jgi:hypothetical protein